MGPVTQCQQHVTRYLNPPINILRMCLLEHQMDNSSGSSLVRYQLSADRTEQHLEDMCDTEHMFGVVELPPYSNDNIIRHKYSDVECTDSEFQSSEEDDSCEISSIENEEF
uniref:Uncharacterized protein n=1 Tax=Timema cristinae TaxID=61476 RepID=A0A7R9CV57_TIMCR|nr:unnamed protein product [Timema cristinae]